ncbi:hypothetical protein C84B14_12281 [Salinisphaera sp. C84B14]
MPIAALLRKIVPDNARGAGPGYSTAKPRNAVWQDFGRNPRGRRTCCTVGSNSRTTGRAGPAVMH